MTIDEANERFSNKRIAVFSKYNNEWAGGILKNVDTNQFPEHGIIAYIGRGPIWDIDINSIQEFSGMLEFLDIKKKYGSIPVP